MLELSRKNKELKIVCNKGSIKFEITEPIKNAIFELEVSGIEHISSWLNKKTPTIVAFGEYDRVKLYDKVISFFIEKAQTGKVLLEVKLTNDELNQIRAYYQ